MRFYSQPLLAAVLITPCLSSGSDATGTLRGVVRDINGAVVPNAIVIIQNLKPRTTTTGRARYTVAEGLVTDSSGEFTSHLTPGRYDIFVTHPALLPVAKRVEIEANKEISRDCELRFDPQTVLIY